MSAHEEINEYARWQARFATPDYAFGKEPNYFLKSCHKLLPRHGRALAVADGEGRNGVWLAAQGPGVLSLYFSPAAQNKGRAFAVVVEIFAQFSLPSERAIKWRGMRRALKPGGLLIIQGYTPKQLQYGT